MQACQTAEIVRELPEACVGLVGSLTEAGIVAGCGVDDGDGEGVRQGVVSDQWRAGGAGGLWVDGGQGEWGEGWGLAEGQWVMTVK